MQLDVVVRKVFTVLAWCDALNVPYIFKVRLNFVNVVHTHKCVIFEPFLYYVFNTGTVKVSVSAILETRI